MKGLTDRHLAYVILCAQIPAFIYLSGSYIFPSVVVVVALASFNQHLRVRMSNRQLYIGGVVLIVLIFILQSLIPIQASQLTSVLGQYGLSFAQYFLAVQVLVLFSEREKELPKLYPLAGGLTLMFLGDRLVNTAEYIAYQASVLIYVGLFVMYLHAGQPRMRSGNRRNAGAIGLTALLVSVAILSAGSSRIAYQYRNELDGALMKLVGLDSFGEGTRLDRQVSLGDVVQMKLSGRTAVALRVYSDAVPGYMRGAVYDQYRSRSWVNSMPGRYWPPVPTSTTSSEIGRFRLSPLSPLESFEETFVTREVWPSKSIGDMVFTQLHAPFVDIDVPDVTLNPHGAVIAEQISAGDPYTLYVDTAESDVEISEEMKEALLALPGQLDERINALALELFAGEISRKEKLRRVVSYFHENYTYNLGIDIPPGQDPIEYFLLERPPGHCELFASGALTLLRLGGVPCRYVTGYVAREKNPVGDYWVARSRDAHAWVEAWDEEEGWVIVEATPASGFSFDERQSRFSYWWDEFKFQLQRIKEAILSGDFVGAMKLMGRKIVQLIQDARVGLITLIGIVILIRVARWLRKRRRRRRLDDFGTDSYTSLLDRMDTLVETKGFRRNAGETLTRFSSRLCVDDGDAVLEEASEWYGRYSASRYNPDRMEGVDTAILEDILEKLELRAERSVSV